MQAIPLTTVTFPAKNAFKKSPPQGNRPLMIGHFQNMPEETGRIRKMGKGPTTEDFPPL